MRGSRFTKKERVLPQPPPRRISLLGAARRHVLGRLTSTRTILFFFSSSTIRVAASYSLDGWQNPRLKKPFRACPWMPTIPVHRDGGVGEAYRHEKSLCSPGLAVYFVSGMKGAVHSERSWLVSWGMDVAVNGHRKLMVRKRLDRYGGIALPADIRRRSSRRSRGSRAEDVGGGPKQSSAPGSAANLP